MAAEIRVGSRAAYPGRAACLPAPRLSTRLPPHASPPTRLLRNRLAQGDVALPGLLVAMLARWDAASAPGRSPLRGYAAPVAAAYAGGLALTYAALHWSWFGGGGQPALLYLVPSTLGTTLALAAARGELAALWDAELLQEPPADERDASGPDEPEAEAHLLSSV